MEKEISIEKLISSLMSLWLNGERIVIGFNDSEQKKRTIESLGNNSINFDELTLTLTRATLTYIEKPFPNESIYVVELLKEKEYEKAFAKANQLLFNLILEYVDIADELQEKQKGYFDIGKMSEKVNKVIIKYKERNNEKHR